jgi:hypothetical protein
MARQSANKLPDYPMTRLPDITIPYTSVRTINLTYQRPHGVMGHLMSVLPIVPVVFVPFIGVGVGVGVLRGDNPIG